MCPRRRRRRAFFSASARITYSVGVKYTGTARSVVAERGVPYLSIYNKTTARNIPRSLSYRLRAVVLK